MNYNSVRTIHLTNLEIARSTGLPFEPIEFSTLNEKHDILPGFVIPSGEYPSIQYIAIGRGGHANVNGNNGAALQDILQHAITDAALFDQIPFRIEPADAGGVDSMPSNERSKYRMKKFVDNGDGTFQNEYYLRRISLVGTQPESNILETQNGNTSVTPFIPTDRMLNPEAVQITTGQVVNGTGRHISTRVPVQMVLDQEDIAHIINACEVKYGSANYATISEVVMASGYELPNTHPSYPEVVNVQCCSFIGTMIPLNWSRESVTLNYDLGDTAPLLV